MRASAVRYMMIHGAVIGTGILMFIMFLSTLGSGFSQMVLEEAGYNLLLVIGFYITVSLLPSFFLGGIGGGTVGFITGLCMERFVNRYYEPITDAGRYTRTLTLLTGGLSAAVTLMGILLFFRYSLSPMSPAGIALVAVVGGLTGRGFACHDMKQRREKKETSKEMADFQPVHRFELREDMDNAVFAEGSDRRLRHEMDAVREIK